MSTFELSPPALISAEHILDAFDCGEESLENWFVVCAAAQVIGYYTLYAGAISRHAAPKSMRRNMPDPLPVLFLGRLAIDRRFHNQGLGKALLRDAMMRSVHIANDSGVFAILLHAISEQGQAILYVAMTHRKTLESVRAILAEAD